MVHVLVFAFALLLGSAEAAFQTGAAPVLSLGGAISSTSSGATLSTIASANVTYFTLWGGGTLGANTYGPLMQNGGVYKTKPDRGTHCVSMTLTSSTANEGLQLCSGNTAVAAGGGVAPSNVKWQFGAASIYGVYATTAGAFNAVNLGYDFEPGVFPCWEAQSNVAYAVGLICAEW